MRDTFDCTVDNFPIGFMLFRTATMATAFGFGGYLLLGLGTWTLIPFGIVSVALFLYILRTVCRHCHYYGRRCDLGLGKLAVLILKTGGLNQALYVRNAKKSIPWIFIVLALPMAAGIIMLATKFTLIMFFKVLGYLVLVCFFVLSGQITACPRCRMNKICPASIYRK